MRTFQVPMLTFPDAILKVGLAPVANLSLPPWSSPVESAVVGDPGPDRSGMLVLLAVSFMSFLWA